MKKAHVFLTCLVLFLTYFTASAQVFQHRTGVFLEFRGLQADFNGWKVRYQPTDTIAYSGFDININRARRSVAPLWAVFQEISFWNRLLVRIDWSSKFTKDNHISLAAGLGYQQPIAPNSRFPMSLRILGLYEYWNYGVKVYTYQQGATNLQFGKKEILADNVFVLLGNRQHIIRPQLGFSVNLGSNVELAIEGYYCFVLASESRVSVRGGSLFYRRSSIISSDNRLEVRNKLDQPVTNWNVMDRWGIRIGIVYKAIPE